MLKDLQTTLYDVFGYALPGLIALTAVTILLWSIWLPNTALPAPAFSGEGWIAVLVVAYVLGHLCQAAANQFLPRQASSNRMLSATGGLALPEAIITRVTVEVAKATAIDITHVDSHWLYQICDEFVAQHGKTNDREMYIYREGFYRGACGALILLALALLARLAIPGAALLLNGEAYPLGGGLLFSLVMIAAIGAGLTFARYNRFGDYRVTQAILGFLALRCAEQPNSHPKK